MPHVTCFLCGTTWTVTKEQYARLMQDMSPNRYIICRKCKIEALTKAHVAGG